MLQHNILAGNQQLIGTIVCGHITSKRKRVTLFETHMSKGIKRIRLFVEVSAVTPKLGSLMAEMHASFCYLRIGIDTIHIVTQFIGMHQIDTVVFRLSPTLACWRHRLHHT